MSAASNRAEFSCQGKVRFASAKLARDIAKRTRHSHEIKATPYHCPHCGGWHIGSRLVNELHKRRLAELRAEEA